MKKLDEKFDIMTEVDLSVTEGGIVVTTSTAIAWGILGVYHEKNLIGFC